MRIVLCYPVEPKHLSQIEACFKHLGVEAEIINAGQERIAEELPKADIYCGHAKVPVPWEEVMAAGKLQWIQSSAAGMDHCLVPPVQAADLPVTSASGVLADQVADHTLALTLGLLRSLPVFFRAQQQREFIRRPTHDLHEAKIGIVGFGGNGRRLAEVFHAFRTEIHATDLFPADKPAHVATLRPADELDQMLGEVDIVILTAPLNDDTRGMFDARRISLMHKNSWLVNVARGPLVVEEALADALESGHLAGAALDVTEIEPLAAESRLWELPNALITPHVGGQAARRIDDMTDFFCENIERFVAGKRLRNLVDKRLGFPLPENAAWNQSV